MELKSRNLFKAHKSHGEVADADTEPPRARIPYSGVSLSSMASVKYPMPKNQRYSTTACPKLQLEPICFRVKRYRKSVYRCCFPATPRLVSSCHRSSLVPVCDHVALVVPVVLIWDSTILRIQVRG